jgi:hypothetical protein
MIPYKDLPPERRAKLEQSAARSQTFVDNLNRNALKDATPEERASAERFHRLRQECGLERSAEYHYLISVSDNLKAPNEDREAARAELRRREAEFERRLAEAV